MTGTWYADLSPFTEPEDAGLDSDGRAMVSFKVLCWKQPSADVAAELVKRLEDEGCGTRAVSLFATSSAAIPDGDGPFTQVTEIAGASPVRTQNNVPGPSYQRPVVQVLVRARLADTAMTTAKAAYAALNLRNTQLSA